MKKIFLLLTLFFISSSYAKDTAKGAIAGKLMDKEISGETLPFANVIIKGTSLGTTTDIDGLYSLENIITGT